MEIPYWAKSFLLLLCSNCFMTVAWYGHLRFKELALPMAILFSWLLALPEYALQVPANRVGYGQLTAYQLKIMQECITFAVFIFFAWFALGEAPTWRYLISMGLITLAVVVAFL